MRESVINGKLYSTNTATPLGQFCSRYPMTDPRYYEETLYCNDGEEEYFLHVCGGAQSKYASVTGAGSAIIPLTLEESFEWSDGNYNVSARSFNPDTEVLGEGWSGQ